MALSRYTFRPSETIFRRETMTDDHNGVDRRDFLHASTLAGLAALAATSAEDASAQTSPDPAIFDQGVGVPLQVRRVVTGHDNDGAAIVAIDEITDNIYSRRAGMQGSVIWSTGESPADNMTPGDGADRPLDTSDDNGTVFRIVKYDPGVVPREHRTQSIDYAIVLSGEIYMGIGDGEVLLREGDVLVQRGTLHDWINRGPLPCVVAFILCAAKPVEIDGRTLGATG
jgi:mannose-6-phosphate isomerase-like protein (cupin superfamily)